jgi:adenylate cyclase
MAIPITAFERLLGVLYVENVADLHFGYDDEDALVAFAAQLGLAMHHLQQAEEQIDEGPVADAPAVQLAGPPLLVRHFAANDSIFLDDDYLIKGVAGSILWTLLSDYSGRGRTSFTNKGLRVDPRIRLPGVSDNLEARLVLLERRLDERAAGIRLRRTGRGRFALEVARPLTLISG